MTPLVGPDGQRLGASDDPRVSHLDFTISSNFDPDLGLAQVVLRAPVNPALTAVLDEMQHTTAPVDLGKLHQWLMALSKNLAAPTLLLPKEAQLLGLQLIISSETAIGTAMMMRTLLGLTDPPMSQAQVIDVWTELSKIVRGSHAVQWELFVKERQAMNQGGPHGSGEPS